MSEVSDLLQHYKEVRQRLRHPPNAVPDTGINLKKEKTLEPPKPKRLLPAPPQSVPVPAPLPPIEEKPQPGVIFCSTLAVTADVFGLRYSEIRQKSRKPRIVLPRQVAVYVATKQRKWSFSQMGRYLGLDHTTILYARNKIQDMIRTDDKLRENIRTIENELASMYPSTNATEHK